MLATNPIRVMKLPGKPAKPMASGGGVQVVEGQRLTLVLCEVLVRQGVQIFVRQGISVLLRDGDGLLDSVVLAVQRLDLRLQRIVLLFSIASMNF